jgi:ketol-acid reductoisomerase
LEVVSTALFVKQGVGSLLSRCLMTAYQVLVDTEYPPEAVILDLYVFGELAKSFQAMAEQGISKQLELHSPTNQYGGMTRSARLDMGLFVNHLKQVFDEIRTGAFVEECGRRRKSPGIRYSV